MKRKNCKNEYQKQVRKIIFIERWKFKFLTKDSIKRNINTKSFNITNLVLFIVIAILINLDSIVKLFGGDFDKLTHVYIVDEMGIYDDVNETMKNSYLDVLNNYNAEVRILAINL